MDGSEQERPTNTFVCPICRRKQATDKRFCDCPHCSEPMVPYAEWKRHQQDKGRGK